MNAVEQELRSALDGALSIDERFLRPFLAKFEELQFVLDDSLSASLRTGSGRVTICYSPGGRVLKIVALFSDPESSATITYRLPREYWRKTRRTWGEVVAASAARR